MRLISFLDRVIHFISQNIKKRLWFLYGEYNTNYKENDVLCEIDVLITLIEKDILVAEKCIENVRLFSMNKIRNIYIIAPNSDKINIFCNKFDCIFVNEDVVSPYTSDELLLKGINKQRLGWIKQQLIKLNSDSLSDLMDKYLIMDADTILLKPQYFSKNNCDVLKFSDEFHFLYRVSSRLILGNYLYSFNSYISHHQLINKKTLSDMKLHITNLHQEEWYEIFIDAALKNNNYVSEYEIYAQYTIQMNKERVLLQYWFNSNNLYKDMETSSFIQHKAQSISFHNYE
jgi:hypothetical protein